MILNGLKSCTCEEEKKTQKLTVSRAVTPTSVDETFENCENFSIGPSHDAVQVYPYQNFAKGNRF